jgi:hypothetical protein
MGAVGETSYHARPELSYLLTKTSGAKAAIDHLKKVHDLAHAKPAVAAE